MLKKNSLTGMILVLSLVILIGCSGNSSSDNPVPKPVPPDPPFTDSVRIDPVAATSTVTKHYMVYINYKANPVKSAYEIGQLYGYKIIHEVDPDYEKNIRLYIYDTIQDLKAMTLYITYDQIKERLAKIKPQIHQTYRDEIDGFATNFDAAASKLPPGDTLSAVELAYTVNLLPDVLRPFACNAFGVDAIKSTTGHSILYRNLEWSGGHNGFLNKMHAITRISNGSRSVISIGFLGVLSVISGVNTTPVYAAILDSNTFIQYDLSEMDKPRSYVYDLRYSLESFGSVDEIAGFMTNRGESSTSQYAYNHNIFLGDAEHAAVVENFTQVGGTSKKPVQLVRVSSDPTMARKNLGIMTDYWYAKGMPGFLPVINTFLKENQLFGGNLIIDNNNIFPYFFNYLRIKNIKDRFIAMNGETGRSFSADDVKYLMTFSNSTGDVKEGSYYKGDVYTDEALQLMLFEPYTKTLKVFFTPFPSVMPTTAQLRANDDYFKTIVLWQ